MATTATPSARRFELDWLRVLAIAAVFLFHSGRFFDPQDWHVKNPSTHPALEILAALAIVWMMPLLFTISGASTFYALRKRCGGAFLKDRAQRLLVPLVVGIFTHAVWQVYLERTTHYQFSGSFWQFLPHYFDGLYGVGGNFAWMGRGHTDRGDRGRGVDRQWRRAPGQCHGHGRGDYHQYPGRELLG